MFHCFNLRAYIRFVVKVLIKTNVNISNELHYSDVYLNVNYSESHANYVIQCSLHFDKPQRNEIHS